VNEKFERIQLADENQVFESLKEILRIIDQEELNGVFQAWVQQVQEVSSDNEDYVR
jgi:hypothetical protein